MIQDQTACQFLLFAELECFSCKSHLLMGSHPYIQCVGFFEMKSVQHFFFLFDFFDLKISWEFSSF